MSAEDWSRLKELFKQALDFPDDARPAFLVSACGADEALRIRLEEMLRAHGEGDSLLDTDPPGMPASPVRALAAGQRFAHFTIVREIGAGGMGAIFDAEQEQPRRRVALKVMRSGLPSESAVRRFRHESELLGRMHHPGIAQIHEAGVDTVDGAGGAVPWFSMELVAGAPLNEHAIARELPVRARAELFTKVCDAVHHAHEHGVVHRDLKPTNILVGADGQPKVLDFGVARLMEGEEEFSTMHTGAGEMLGTLSYMSPEQVRGDVKQIDVRSDVYSLGVVLYELLSSRLPYAVQGTPLPRAMRIIEEDEPTRPTEFVRALPRDLETIVLKALEKDPARRYASAALLAEDLRRFLRDVPILAKPASTTDQIVKFTRRHKTAVVGLVAVFVVLVIGIVGTSVGLLRARASADEAHAESQTSAAVSSFLSELLAKGDPLDFSESLAPAPMAARDRKLVDVLREASPTLEQKFLGKPNVEALLRAAFGRAFFGLGLWKDAEREERRAVELFRQIGGPDDSRALHAEIAHIWVLEWLGRYDEAVQVGTEALAACRRVFGPNHRDTLRVELRFINARAARRDPQAAHDLADLIERSAAALGPDDLNVIEERVFQTMLLGFCAKDHKAAEACGRDALDRIARKTELGPDPLLRYACENFYGNAIAQQGNFERALEVYRSALAGYQHHLGADHSLTLIVQGNVGWTLTELGQYEEAERVLRESATKLCADENTGPLHVQTAIVMSVLAGLLERTHRYVGAVEWREKVVKAMETQYPPGHEEIRSAREDLERCRTESAQAAEKK